MRFRRRFGRHRLSSRMVIILGAGAFVSLIWLLCLNSDERQAEKAIRTFYKYEQAGDFGNSWELLGQQMKLRYNKSGYIQTRAHVFMQDFGVQTFDFKMGAAVKVSPWRMSKESSTLPWAYKVPVTQQFNSSFGDFKVQQDVYAIKENKKWKIMWSYE